MDFDLNLPQSDLSPLHASLPQQNQASLDVDPPFVPFTLLINPLHYDHMMSSHVLFAPPQTVTHTLDPPQTLSEQQFCPSDSSQIISTPHVHPPLIPPVIPLPEPTSLSLSNSGVLPNHLASSLSHSLPTLSRSLPVNPEHETHLLSSVATPIAYQPGLPLFPSTILLVEPNPSWRSQTLPKLVKHENLNKHNT